MFTAPAAVAAISHRTGVALPFVRQIARRLREKQLLPTARGRASAPIHERHLAMLIIASLLGPGIEVAYRRAVMLTNSGLIPTLARYIAHADDGNHPKLIEIRLDLTNGRTAVVDDTPADEVVDGTRVAVDNKAEADAWLRDFMVSEVRLSGAAVYRIIHDMKRA